MKNFKKIIRKITMAVTMASLFVMIAVPVMASETTAEDGDPLKVIGNLNDLIFGFIRLVGVAFAGFGIFQIATSIPSHDSGQRAMGIACCGGAILMIFAKEILSVIGAV